MYDIVIIGANFAGLTLAHHLPKKYKILILDQKKKLDAQVESTGLITKATRDLLADFIQIDQFIPNKITTIGVISVNYDDYFFSHSQNPWIFSTDTPKLLDHMSKTIVNNVTILTNSTYLDYKVSPHNQYPVKIKYKEFDHEKTIETKFIVGADGADSKVAKSNPHLSQNKKFLIGLEKVFPGKINLGENPKSTVYHFWFGDFSLGYGGWLSPTIINKEDCFRVGLAKLKNNVKDIKKLDDFIEILTNKKIIKIKDDSKSLYTFSNNIAIGGVLKNLYDDYSLLIGEAAGFCGAFAADGIKGAVVSGKVAAKLLPKYLEGNKKAFRKYKSAINSYQNLIRYYRKQKFYRFIWNQLKENRTFYVMYKIIAREKQVFLNQFCDSKDKGTSLTKVILKWDTFPLLIKFSFYFLIDFLFKRGKK